VKNLSEIDNLDFSLFFMGIFYVLCFDGSTLKNPKGGPYEKVKYQGCQIALKFCTAYQNAKICKFKQLLHAQIN
jgi:mRNA deadenylase 3'-5' endonuclease subunit Ccr4